MERQLPLNSALMLVDLADRRYLVIAAMSQFSPLADSGRTFFTGVDQLDQALGPEGILPGQLVEVCGPEGSGKTFLCLSMAREAQRWGPCLFLDCDHSLSLDLALRFRIDPWYLYVADPQTARQAFEMAEALLSTGAIPLVIIDSFTSLVFTGSLGDDLTTGERDAQSRQVAAMLRRLSQVVKRSRSLLVFTTRPSHGPAGVYHGLRDDQAWLALKLQSALRLTLSEPQPVCEEGQVVGHRVRVQGSWRGWSFPNLPVEVDFMYNGCVN